MTSSDKSASLARPVGPMGLSRRGLLSGAVGSAVLTGSPLLSACQTATTEPQSNDGGRSDIEFPTYVPYEGVETDYPATEAGGLAAFLGMERPPVDAIPEVPGAGGEVSVLFETEIPVPPPLGSNKYWQNLNAKLGVDLKMSPTPSDQYRTKISTMLAGGDLPDIVSLPVSRQAGLPDLMEARFTDLTGYLAGDAVQDYPMLAVRSESMWRNTVFNGKIFGVPTPNSRVSGYVVARQDVLDSHGLSPEVGSADEFTELCLALTDEKNNRWADGRPAATFNGFICEMFGVPNKWRVENGEFTSHYLTEEFTEALAYVADLWQKGVFHPDAFNGGVQAQIDNWGSGRTALFSWGGTGWSGPLAQYGPRTPGFDLSFLHPPKAEGGGQAAKYLGSGAYRMGAIRKGMSEDRVRELLRIMNYIAAAYGTSEYLDIYYGAEDEDWTWQEVDGGLWLPERTERGLAERTMIFYLSGPLFVLSAVGYPKIIVSAYEFMKNAAETGAPLPTAGLYSETDNTKGATLDTDLTALVTDIITGRKKVSEWSEGVDLWRTGGGEEITVEYAQAYADAGGS